MPKTVAFLLVLLVVGLSPLEMVSSARATNGPTVSVRRLPDGGVQPQAAVDTHGRAHVIYFRGEPGHGDLYYMHSTDRDAAWSVPMRVNSTAGTAIATGTIRGGQLALGDAGRVHVAWNGSQPTSAGVTPMFYARLDDSGTTFEPQRNVTSHGYDIDGGGAVAADRRGHVYVVWHANAPGESEEGKRRVWVARSDDGGRTFEQESAAWNQPTGACGCCGLGAFADAHGSLFVLFRSAFEGVNRDMYLLASSDGGRHFDGRQVDKWNVGICVMSSQAFAEGASGVFTAWETRGQVSLARIDAASGTVSWVAGAPGEDRTRKHPAIAIDAEGHVLFAWTEGTAWSKGGAAAWQEFDADGHEIGPGGHAEGVPVWGRVAAYADARNFVVLY